MYDQIRGDTIYIMLYAVVTAMAAIASIYLLFRRGNAFAADITPPRRLRRWTAVFFAVLAVGHLWYLPAAVLTSGDDIMLSLLIGALLDCMLIFMLVEVIIFSIKNFTLPHDSFILGLTQDMFVITVMSRNLSGFKKGHKLNYYKK